jgi:hypothetical protein
MAENPPAETRSEMICRRALGARVDRLFHSYSNERGMGGYQTFAEIFCALYYRREVPAYYKC